MDETLEHESEELKAGRVLSAANMARIRSAMTALQEAMDAAMPKQMDHEGGEMGEMPEMMTLAPADEAVLVSQGESVKALGAGRVGGYLVRFSTQSDPDISSARDYFDAQTDFVTPLPAKSAAWFHHGLNVKKQRLSHDAELRLDEFGVWAETVLDERDQYEKFLLGLAEAGKLGWSSGTASHLVKRTAVGDAQHVDRWPLGIDASLTHIPAEPRNSVLPLKALADDATDFPEPDAAIAEAAPQAQEPQEARGTANPLEVKTMEITEEKLTELVAAGAEAALKRLPATPAPAAVTVTHDPADNPFTSLAEQAKAVKTYELSKGRNMDPRLTRLDVKATGAAEAVPSEGGFLLEPTLVGEVLRPMHENGPFTQAVRRLPVGSNSNYGWINGVDETDRATGSRWGGIRGYRLAEGATLTGSKPKFRRINWELKKYAVLCYATDELLQDVSQFSEIVRTGAGEELNFMANDDILNGLGVGGPLGVMNAGALVSVTKETGQAAATILYENLVKMWARLDSRSKPRATWYVNTDINPQLDQLVLAAGTGALEPRFIGYDATGVMRIKGRPVVETEFNATLGTQGDILLADFSQYLFWDKNGVQAASSIHVQFLTDEEVFRFIYRCDGQPAMASPVTPYKGTNTLSAFVALDTRA